MKKKKKQENEKPKNIHYPQSIKDNNAASVMRLLNLSISSKHMLSVLLIFVLAIALYTNTLKNGFAFDDEYTIVNNIMIKDLGNLPKLFNKDYFTLSGEMSYRPLVTFSYFLDYALYGLNPWGFHLTNVLLHAINGMLLYIFLTLIIYPQGFRNQQSSISELLTKPPFFISILFVANPVLTEAVNAVSFREDLLTFLFYTATLNLYLLLKSNFATSRRSFLLYAVSCFLYFAALLSKEMAATLPLIILCYELIYGADEKKGFRAILFNPYNIGYATITLVYLYLRFYSFHNVAEQEIPLWDITYKIYSTPWLFLNYLKLTVFPVSLSIDHYFSPLEHLSVISAILYLIVAIAILALTIVVGRKDRFVAFGMSFFIITLIPVYNIIPIANPFAERYLYLPAIGFLIVAGSVFIRLYEIKNGSHGTSITVIFFIILIINSLSVIERNRVWQDTYSLWTDAVKKSPNNYHAIDNLGLYYYKTGRLNEAIAQFQTATKLNPNYADARRNLGNAYYDSGYFDEAVQQFQIAIRLNPYEPRHYANLAVAYSKIGRLDEAAIQYQAALKLNPDMPIFYFDLGNVYADLGRLDDAIRMYKEGLKLKNDDPIKYYNLGLMYRAQGRIYEAASEFNNTLQINPDYLPARQALQSISEK